MSEKKMNETLLETRLLELENRLKRAEMFGRTALVVAIFAAGFIGLRPFFEAFRTLLGWS